MTTVGRISATARATSSALVMSLASAGTCSRPGIRQSTGSARTTFDENEAYDPKSGKWRKLAALPSGRHGFAAASVGNALYYLGGSTECGSSGRLNDNLAFTLP